MAKKTRVLGPELAIYDPDGNLVQRGLYDSNKAHRKAIELRGKNGEKFRFRPYAVRPYVATN